MNIKSLSKVLLGFATLTIVLTACASPTAVPPTPTPIIFSTLTTSATQTAVALAPTPLIGDATAVPALTSTTSPSSSLNLCSDPQATALIDSLKMAVTNGDGPLLASLVSPTNGVDVAYFHNGKVIKYDQTQDRFLFETTYEADWGDDPASGAKKTGSFHDVVVPKLKESFGQAYTLHCNELKYGGASYPVTFPYNKDFYSIYFPGTEANGNLDWHTWVVGIEYVNGKPYLYALMQFYWEP